MKLSNNNINNIEYINEISMEERLIFRFNIIILWNIIQNKKSNIINIY